MRSSTASTTSSGETFFRAIAAARSTADIQQRASLAMARVSSRDRRRLPRGTRVLPRQRPSRGPLAGGGPGGGRRRMRAATAAGPAGALDQRGILRAEQCLEPAADLARERRAAPSGGDRDLQL